jgi:NADH dehydrogenase
MYDIKEALGSKKPTVHVPLCLVRPAAAVMERLLPRPPVTNEQLDMLQKDNVCDIGSLGAFGISPTTFKAGLKSFL